MKVHSIGLLVFEMLAFVASSTSAQDRLEASDAKSLESLSRMVTLAGYKLQLPATLAKDFGVPKGEVRAFSFPYGEKKAVRGFLVRRRDDSKTDIWVVNVMELRGTSYYYLSEKGEVGKAFFVVDADTRNIIGEPNELFEKELAFWLEWEKKPTRPCRVKKIDSENSLISTTDILNEKTVRDFKLKEGVQVAGSTDGLKDKRLTEGAEVVLHFDRETMAVGEIRVQKYVPEKAESKK